MNGDNEEETKQQTSTSLMISSTDTGTLVDSSNETTSRTAKTGKRKRGLKPKSKRNRKRARGGVGILLNHCHSNVYQCETQTEISGGGGNSDDNHQEYQVQMEIKTLPFELTSTSSSSSLGPPSSSSTTTTTTTTTTTAPPTGAPPAAFSEKSRKRIRIVKPYPFTYATFAKGRWTNRTILDVYNSEFGSYPRSYYEGAIRNGRITVGGKIVSTDYKIKGGDELCHVVHRHEPAVAICDFEDKDDNDNGCDINTPKYITVIHEDNDIIVVDKPSTVPVHPCGGYNFNSLFHILSDQNPLLRGSLHNVHRLDRLTSGLTIVAKNTEMAKALGQCINDRKGCYKVYLARVKGKFPLNAPVEKRFLDEECSTSETLLSPHISNGEWTIDSDKFKKGDAATSIWITNNRGELKTTTEGVTLTDVFQSRIDPKQLENDGAAVEIPVERNGEGSIHWLHLACPCEIICHKNGVCKAGNGKAAQTAFGVVHYDEETDSSVVLARPLTGRTHQIRLHLQYLGHPIANDPNYGGEMFFFNDGGRKMCEEAHEKMKQIDEKNNASNNDDSKTDSGARGNNNKINRPYHAISTDVPATEEEVKCINQYDRSEFKSFLEYLEKSCVWCERSKGEEDRAVLEFLARSQGIWLHALQYSLNVDGKQISYSTPLPKWSYFQKEV